MRTVLFVGAASAALAAAGPDALMPFKDAAGAATEVSVAFIVDFGGGKAPVVGCVRVPAGDNGYAALSAFTAQEGEAEPIYNSAGLLCSINDLPPNAPTVCGERVAGGYDYWAYWHGTSGSWVYASSGAFALVQNGDVEGWRYENPGSSNPSDPQPAAAPNYAAICGPLAVPPTTVTTQSTMATTTTTSPSVPAAHTGPPATSPGTAVTTPGAPGREPPASTAHVSSSPTTSAVVETTTPITTPASTREALAAQPASADRAGGGSAVPLVVGGVLILLLAGGAVLAWRRRTGTP